MTATPQLIGAAGWTDFAAVFSTVFPLLVLLTILAWYLVVARRHP